MKPTDDWSRWVETWQQTQAIDVEQLQRKVQSERRRMRWVMTMRIVGAVIVVGLFANLVSRSGIPTPMRVWGGLMFPVFALIFYLRMRTYRGIWNAAGKGTADLLRLTAKRARAGVRLAWANVAAIVLVSVVSLSFAAPYLTPTQWRHDPNVRQFLGPLIVVNGAIAIVALAINIYYMRRQRTRLRNAEALLQDATVSDSRLE